MATTVTLTGTGVPHPSPGRAGPGVLVRHGDISLQFDAGRGTVIRLVEAGVETYDLTALFVTHVHSDHVIDVADVAMTRWVQQQLHKTGPLTVIAPEGQAARFVRRMFEPYDDDIAVRMEHVGADAPEVELRTFPAPSSRTEVWRSADDTVVVSTVAVHHEPVADAVAYRVDTPDGAVVISGDTRVCDEVGLLADGVDLLVHEACRATAMRDIVRGTVFESIFSYHADTVALGAMAERFGIPHVLLTHLIPAPRTATDEQAFGDDLRTGGFTGKVTVGKDLHTVSIGT